MVFGYRIGGLPLTTVQRLPNYLRVVREMHRAGREVVSSARLGELLRLDPVQVRKDFGLIGIVGRPKIGFRTSELVEAIEGHLNWNRVSAAILVGAGHLGQALLGYRGFANHGLEIRAAFDLDPRSGEVHGIPVHPMHELEARLPELGARMAILTVSPEAAQEAARRLAAAGIEGIWNFTGATLDLPPAVIVQNQDIAVGLAVLSARLSAQGRVVPAPIGEVPV
ncbi:redox-sensing transcriptional repressor Rex [Mesoterricola sediminis]|uniref:Redox-sensing transcriptional repressor Rex n=1 Tax=Mesoterricola sediminis TaxID=2927980 RepID=A0AA48KBE7_9BACT|nr:redox-sensing transcriptional repressor Rex [Mesoterricola sediminis]BDU76024.1 redox-sensing transcriptional repressor Rex [Mesoterricola sediminis]